MKRIRLLKYAGIACSLILAFAFFGESLAQSPRTTASDAKEIEPPSSVPEKSPAQRRTEMMEQRKQEAIRKRREAEKKELEKAIENRMSTQLDRMLNISAEMEQHTPRQISPTPVPAPAPVETENVPTEPVDPELFVPLIRNAPPPGWNYLFDTKTMMGWRVQEQGPYGGGRFTIEDGAICSDAAHPGLIYTTGQFSDFYLEFEMQAEPGACAFLLLRSSPSPKNLATSCAAVILCSPEPTLRTPGTFVGRKESRLHLQDGEHTLNVDENAWNKFTLEAIGEEIKVSGNGFYPHSFWDPSSVQRGYIGFLVTKGKVRFRNISWSYARPKTLMDSRYLESDWKINAKDMAFRPEIKELNLHLYGGPGMLESKEEPKNFVLNAEFRILDRRSIAGICFRCIPGAYLQGYDCRIANPAARKGEKVPEEENYSSGSLFPMLPARKLGHELKQWGNITISAVDNHTQIWLNGIQTIDYFDTRPTVIAADTQEQPDARNGLRLQSGTLQLYGTSPAANVEFRSIHLNEVRDRWPK